MGSFKSIETTNSERNLGKVDALLNEKLQKVEWGEFYLKDLFVKKTIKGVPKKDENLESNKEGYHMFGQNIKYQYPQKIKLDDKYLQIVDKDYPILAYTSSVGEIGLIKESFYRSGDNGAFQGMFHKDYKFNLKELQFIESIIKKQFDFFGYGTGMSNIMYLIIQLPTKNGEIDFEFMESFIAELEAQRIAELEAFLLATGLKDYNLTKEEKQVLADFDNLVWQTYNVENLFGKSTRGQRLKSTDRISGNLPFVTAGEFNDGISAFIGNDVTIFSEKTTTIDMFGSAKYRNYKYGGDDHVAVVHTENLPKLASIFVTTAIHKTSYAGQFSYSNNFYAKDADELNISLPTENNKPNYKIMEIFISAIQKLVIKDVVNYADKKIEATKSVIQN